MPAYLMANVGTDLLEYAGSFQNSLRSFFLWKSSQDYWFPEIRLLVEPYFFSVLFYTHTYFLARTAFQNHVLKQFVLKNAWPVDVILMTATIPLARPPIIVGLL